MIFVLNFLLLAAGLALVVKGADLLVDGASSLALQFGVPSLVIGLTIVSFGTSAPELIVNLSAAFEGKCEIALGNIIGSNIYNILLILGISAIIAPLPIQASTKWKEIPMSAGAVLLLFVLANTGFTKDLFITRLESLFLLGGFALFMWYVIHMAIRDGSQPAEEDPKYKSTAFMILLIVLGLVALMIGGKLTVTGAVNIAQAMHVSEKLIALTIVSIGTSLPELATSAVAAWKKQTDIAVGNVVGSNIFNILLILGLSSVTTPLSYLPVLNQDMMVLGAATLFLFLSTFVGKKNTVSRFSGVILVLGAIVYTGYLIFRG